MAFLAYHYYWRRRGRTWLVTDSLFSGFVILSIFRILLTPLYPVSRNSKRRFEIDSRSLWHEATQ